MRSLKVLLPLLINTSLIVSASIMTSVAQAGSAGTPAPLKITQETHTYQCGSQTVQVTYLNTRSALAGVRNSETSFLVLTYQGRSYGLTEAVSASGARYLGHAGLNTASGLEWWEHQGQATLATFKGDDATTTTPLLTCKL